MIKRLLPGIWLLLLFVACQKKLAEQPSETPAIPDEPVQKLAWNAAIRISSGAETLSTRTLMIQDITNRASIPSETIRYFRNSLQRFLEQQNWAIVESSPNILSGQLLERNERLIFAFTLESNHVALFSDSADIPVDDRLRNTVEQYRKEESKPVGHEHHMERKIPTPLAELKQSPLDVAAICSNSKNACDLLMLFADRLVKRDWEKSVEVSVSLPPPSTYARAPAGKILILGQQIAVFTSMHPGPLTFDENLKPGQSQFSLQIPLPERGLNTFALADGRFFDFDLAESNVLVATGADSILNVAQRGSVVISDRPVGASVAASLPAIYTSSSSLPGAPDAVMKFSFDQGQLTFHTSRSTDGEVLDLAVTDLNLDQQKELLVTVHTERGIFIEVDDLF